MKVEVEISDEEAERFKRAVNIEEDIGVFFARSMYGEKCEYHR